VLDAAGFETEIALTGEVGVNVALDRRVDLLLADEAVEDFQNVKKIKDPASPTYRLPTMVISSNGADHASDDIKRLIPFAVVPREFDADELVVKIRRAVEVGDRLNKRVVA